MYLKLTKNLHWTGNYAIVELATGDIKGYWSYSSLGDYNCYLYDTKNSNVTLDTSAVNNIESKNNYRVFTS